jgi:hypothetical protein
MPPDPGPVEGDGGSKTSPSDVLIFTAEDGLADTIRPRLDAAGADSSRVSTLRGTRTAVEGLLLQFPEDIDLLAEALDETRASMVIIDPFFAFLSGRLKSGLDQEVRRALTPLADLADRSRACIVLVRHLRKAGASSALYRGGGSIGIIGAARLGLVVAADPSDDNARLVAVTKSNLSAIPPTLRFRVVDAENGSGRVEWDRTPSDLSADELLAETAEGNVARPRFQESRVEKAGRELRELLLETGPVPAREALRRLTERGFFYTSSGSQAMRLKQVAGIRSRRVAGPSGSFSLWFVPGDD